MRTEGAYNKKLNEVNLNNNARGYCAKTICGKFVLPPSLQPHKGAFMPLILINRPEVPPCVKHPSNGREKNKLQYAQLFVCVCVLLDYLSFCYTHIYSTSQDENDEYPSSLCLTRAPADLHPKTLWLFEFMCSYSSDCPYCTLIDAAALVKSHFQNRACTVSAFRNIGKGPFFHIYKNTHLF